MKCSSIVYILAFLATLPLMHDARSDKVSSVAIDGIERIEEGFVLFYLGIKAGDDVHDVDISAAIKRIYATGYFAHVSIKNDNGKLIVSIIENPIVNNVIIQGTSSSLKKAFIKDMRTKVREVYSRDKIRYDAERIRATYFKSGYYNASIKPMVKVLDRNRSDVIFDIQENDVSKVFDVVFIGNNFFSDSALLGSISNERAGLLSAIFKKGFQEDSLHSDSDNIVTLYKNAGFSKASVTGSIAEVDKEGGKIIISFIINEGLRYKFGNIEAVYNTSIDKKYNVPQKSVLCKRGKWFNESEVHATVGSIKDFLSTHGMFNAIVSPQMHYNQESGTIDIKFIISKTELVYINNIIITGNHRTYDYVIRRELNIHEGDVYDSTKIAVSRSKLLLLGLFSKVDIKEKAIPGQGAIDLEIAVEESPHTLSLSLSGGWSTFEGALINLSSMERNLLGRGYSANTTFINSGYQNTFALGFTAPRIADTEISAGFNAMSSRIGGKDFLMLPYQSNVSSISKYITYPILDHFFHTLNVTLRSDVTSLTQHTESFLWNSIAGDRTSAIIGQSFTFDKRNSPIMPTRGFHLSISQNYSGLAGLGNQYYISHEFDTSAYIPIIGDEWTLLVAARGGHIHGLDMDVAFPNRYMVGYYNMRGFNFGGIGPRTAVEQADGTTIYDKTSFRGNTYGVMTFELHTPTPMPREYGFKGAIFCDFGTLYGVDGKKEMVDSNGLKTYVIDSRSIRMSAGVGLIWLSPMGPLRVDFAQPILKEVYDNVMTIRINFSAFPFM